MSIIWMGVALIVGFIATMAFGAALCSMLFHLFKGLFWIFFELWKVVLTVGIVIVGIILFVMMVSG